VISQPEQPVILYLFALVELFEVTWLVFIDEEFSGSHPLHTGKIKKARTKINKIIFLKFFMFIFSSNSYLIDSTQMKMTLSPENCNSIILHAS